MPVPDGKPLTLRVPVDVHDRLKRLFHGKGSHKYGKTTFRRYVAAFLDHASFQAEAELQRDAT